MVFFTCNACGSSIKKPQADKHIYQCGYGCSSFSCMDCGKDFSLQTYKLHTKCVTEEEKYSAQGWKPPTSHNKGERKQQEWVDLVQSIVNTNINLDFSTKQLLKTISKHDNVPRKRPKFINFVKNITKNQCTEKTIETCWTSLEEKGKEMKESKSTTTNNSNNDSQLKPVSNVSENDKHSDEMKAENVKSNVEKKKAKKNKKNKDESIENGEEAEQDVTESSSKTDEPSTEAVEVNEEVQSKPKKKKKHKKHKENTDENENVTDAADEHEGLEGQPEDGEGPKKDNTITIEADDSSVVKKKKKKKKRHHEKENEAEVIAPEENGSEANISCSVVDTTDIPQEVDTPNKEKKSKKKKRKHEETEVMESSNNFVPEAETAEEHSPKRKKKKHKKDKVRNHDESDFTSGKLEIAV